MTEFLTKKDGLFEKLDSLYSKLQKIGIDIILGSNYPWIYLDYINGVRVKEKLDADHGFAIAFFPIKPGKKIKLNNIPETFKLIRKYCNEN
jgi:hypothetical protein